MAQLASGTQLPIRAEAERSIRLVAVIATEGAFCASSVNSRTLMACSMADEDELAVWMAIKRLIGSAMWVPSVMRAQEKLALLSVSAPVCTAIGAAATMLSSGNSCCTAR